MKGRESGMPEPDFWKSFFYPDAVLRELLPSDLVGPIVEFGSGYGTFTLPLARHTSNLIIGIDIEADLICKVKEEALALGLNNLKMVLRDFVEDGTGLGDSLASHVLLFNILHIENPRGLLAESFRILQPGGTISVIHWRSDIPTPRGPSLDIRPTPEQCIPWAIQEGFHLLREVNLGYAAPYHFGLLFKKPYKLAYYPVGPLPRL